MSVDFKDLVLIPCMNTFGKSVFYQHQSGQSVQINAVFDEVSSPHDAMSGMDAGGSGVMASRVVIGIRLDDLPFKPDMGDRATVNGLEYYVQEVQVDGQGGAHLILNNAEV